MKTNIFVPETIKVGFQTRDDTYTKKLAYVIYYDQNGKLRKETSWNNWRDKHIKDLDFKNEPTSGFVLNKKVGGDRYNWNQRQTYIRVYDPRDFELEISVPNLLYILENTSSIKGKGLEGEFVYGWDGTELVLIPTSSPEYEEISKFNEIIHTRTHIKAKDLVLGYTYKTKSNEQWVYLGRFEHWSRNYSKNTYESNGLYHFFYEIKDTFCHFRSMKSIGDKIISVISDTCASNYAELFDKLECEDSYSPVDETKTEYIPYTFDEFKNSIRDYSRIYGMNKKEYTFYSVDSKRFNCYVDFNDYYSKKLFTTGTIEELFDIVKPAWKCVYLRNGKLFAKY